MSTPTKALNRWPLSLSEGLAGAAGVVAVVASLAGFIPGLYRDRAVIVAQSHGYDVGNLIVAALLGMGLIWSVRGSTRGRLVVIGALGCLVYSYVTYAFLVVLNPMTILYIAVLGLAGWSVATGLLNFDATEVQRRAAMPFLRRTTSVFLLAATVLFAGNWLKAIGAGVTSGHLPSDLAAAGWPMNPVWVLDLGFVLPLMALGGVQLLRRRPLGAAIAVPVLVFMPLLAATILAMTVSMMLAGQALDLMLVGLFGLIAVLSSAQAVGWLYGARDGARHSLTAGHRLATGQPT